MNNATQRRNFSHLHSLGYKKNLEWTNEKTQSLLETLLPEILPAMNAYIKRLPKRSDLVLSSEPSNNSTFSCSEFLEEFDNDLREISTEVYEWSYNLTPPRTIEQNSRTNTIYIYI